MQKRAFLYIALGVLGGLLCFWNLSLGSQGSLWGQTDALSSEIFWNLRLPRLLTALLAGACLALSGYLMQVLVHNPLGDPFLLGTSAGASLAANLAFAGLVPVSLAGLYLPPLYAGMGGIGATLLAIRLAGTGGASSTRLILAGVALTALLGALTTLITYLAPSDSQIRVLVFWSAGHLDKASWGAVWGLSLALVGGLALAAYCHRGLLLWIQGAEQARLLGLETRHLRLFLLLGGCILTSLTVAWVGIIGFVGLLIPHIMRQQLGMGHRAVYGLTALAGGLYLVLSDTLARWLFPPAGLPAGLMASFGGAAFFVYLQAQSRFSFDRQ